MTDSITNAASVRSDTFAHKHVKNTGNLSAMGKQMAEQVGRDAQVRVKTGWTGGKTIYAKSGTRRPEQFDRNGFTDSAGREAKLSEMKQTYIDTLDKQYFAGFGNLIFAKVSEKDSTENKNILTVGNLVDMNDAIKDALNADKTRLVNALVKSSSGLTPKEAKPFVDQLTHDRGWPLSRDIIDALRTENKLSVEAADELGKVLSMRESIAVDSGGMNKIAERLDYLSKSKDFADTFDRTGKPQQLRAALQECQENLDTLNKLSWSTDPLNDDKRAEAFVAFQKAYATLFKLRHDLSLYVKDFERSNRSIDLKMRGVLAEMGQGLTSYLNGIYAMAQAVKPSDPHALSEVRFLDVLSHTEDNKIKAHLSAFFASEKAEAIRGHPLRNNQVVRACGLPTDSVERDQHDVHGRISQLATGIDESLKKLKGDLPQWSEPSIPKKIFVGNLKKNLELSIVHYDQLLNTPPAQLAERTERFRPAAEDVYTIGKLRKQREDMVEYRLALDLLEESEKRATKKS